MKKSFFLAIAGNIGVGKTNLTKALNQRLGWRSYYEPVVNNPYLENFYEDMQRWSFHLQMFFLSKRFEAQREFMLIEESFIQDRTIYEDGEVFARTLYEQGSMTEVDYENYKSLFDLMVSFLRPPDMIIYLEASPEVLLGRIENRGRDCEKSITLEYLSRLDSAYKRWVDKASSYSRIYRIDTERTNFVKDTEAVESLVEMLKMEEQNLPSIGALGSKQF